MAIDPKLTGDDTLLRDFEILEPPKRTATLRGESIDLSIVPAGATLKFIGFLKKHDLKALENMVEDNFDENVLNDIVEIVAFVCMKSNQKITREWLLSNLSITDLMKFITFVFAGMTQLKNEEVKGDSGKN